MVAHSKGSLQERRVPLRRNALWALCGNVIYAITQWAILIVLAKLLSPEAIGQFALGLAISAPVFGFANLQLRAIQATDVRNEWAISTYVALRLATSLFALVFVIVLVITQRQSAETAMVVVLVAISKSIEALADICYGILQRHEDLRRVSLSLIQRGVMGLTFATLAVATTHDVASGALALAVAWAIVLVWYDIRNALGMVESDFSWSGPAVRVPQLLGLARAALPMGAVIGINSLTQNIPRYFVADALGNAAVGYFSAISYVLAAVTVVVAAVGQAITPRLANYYANDIHAYLHLIWKAMGAAFLVGALGLTVAATFGESILVLLYTEDYGAYVSVFVWTMVAAAMFGCVSVLGVAITAARRFRSQAVVSFVMMLVSVVACLIFIPRYGLDGAAGASVVALGFKFVLQLVQLRLIVRQRSLVLG